MKDQLIVVGCNYHTTWQSDKAMRFILSEVRGNRVRLTTRISKTSFWTNKSDLIFIDTEHNREKAEKILLKNQATAYKK